MPIGRDNKLNHVVRQPSWHASAKLCSFLRDFHLVVDLCEYGFIIRSVLSDCCVAI